MAYLVSLTAREAVSTRDKLRLEQRLTVALSRGTDKLPSDVAGPPLVMVLLDDPHGGRQLQYLGVRARQNTVGPVDRSITIDPLRECIPPILLDGPDGLLQQMPHHLADEFDRDAPREAVGECRREVWEAVDAAVRRFRPDLVSLLNWLHAQASPVVFDSKDPADRSWQEQQDAIRTAVSVADFPRTAIAAWTRPGNPDAPYLAGLIPHPPEHSLIEHDIRAADVAFGMELASQPDARCHIHVLRDGTGRQLEIANVNATGVENRTGTDMIYYHQPTSSFVLVQYKRLESRARSLKVTPQLLGQLDRLEGVAMLSQPAARPDDWRLTSDSCFLKLAYWPHVDNGQRVDGLAPGMYLPLSYIRLLLQNECTGDGDERWLGYEQVARHLINTQFIELAKNGLAGTVGVSARQLNKLVAERVKAKQSVVVATESGETSAKARQRRVNSRQRTPTQYTHTVYEQETLPFE